VEFEVHAESSIYGAEAFDFESFISANHVFDFEIEPLSKRMIL
jgi:hypothetical protein